MPSQLKSECQQLLDTTLPKQTVSGAFLRIAAIKLFVKLYHEDIDPLLKELLSTIVRASELIGAKCPGTSGTVPDLELLSCVPQGTYFLADMSRRFYSTGLTYNYYTCKQSITYEIIVTRDKFIYRRWVYRSYKCTAGLWVELTVTYPMSVRI